MVDVWEFVNIKQDESHYVDGTIIPHIDFDVVLNGKKVGRANVHMHRHRGDDKVTDVSFGSTFVVYGPIP